MSNAQAVNSTVLRCPQMSWSIIDLTRFRITLDCYLTQLRQMEQRMTESDDQEAVTFYRTMIADYEDTLGRVEAAIAVELGHKDANAATNLSV